MQFSTASAVLLAVAACAVPGDCGVIRDTAAVTKPYDYIIVGGGTAGSAIAARLSQGLPGSRILLIEAGPAALQEDRINIPGMKGSTLGSIYDWNFTTVAQSHLGGRSLPASRGKVLGGSSALNLMTWDRAAVAEYDGWEELGNPGWNWNNMIEAMEQVETFGSINTPDYGNEGVGTTGPIHTVVNRIIPQHQQLWSKAMDGLGIPNNRNSLGGDPLGYMNQPSNINSQNWTRSYAANAYIPLGGENLDILLESRVSKVNLQTSGSLQTATGVTMADGSVITAQREVILSAGSFQSPGLLELSGIGSEKVLTAAGVKQIIDLESVGENLQDHVRYQASYQLKEGFSGFDILRHNATYAAEQLALWRQNNVSLYDYTGSGYGFFNWEQVVDPTESSTLSELAKASAGNSTSVVDKKKLEYLADLSIPQVEIIFSDGYTGFKGYPARGSPLFGQNYFTLLGVVMHPLSRGSVHITSNDIVKAPRIDPNYLSSAHDLRAAINIAKYCRKVATTAPLTSSWVSEYEPGMAVTTDEQWKQYVLNTTLSIYHPVGTCAMLPQKDGGVVSPELKVYGTTNLRVVDASIMPVLLSAHIQTAVYGIAERAAAMIIKDYRT
ncbi:choline dehydrogenase [Microdochium nivale]|nr:choline dehydrogenase [Microdochium nivale]